MLSLTLTDSHYYQLDHKTRVYFAIALLINGEGYSFIHSGHFCSAPSSPLLLGGAPDYSTDTVSELHVEAHRQLQVIGLAQSPYVAARAGVEPTTLRLKELDRLNQGATTSLNNSG